MSEASPRLGLPFLQPGQAQKELFHNEALSLLDALVQPVVQAIGGESPPASPQLGLTWVVGEHPTGAWAGRAGAIATWTAGGWRFVAPIDGMAVWTTDDGMVARRAGGAWTRGILAGAEVRIGGIKVLDEQQPPIPEPQSGTTIDAPGRSAIVAILMVLRKHGLIAS